MNDSLRLQLYHYASDTPRTLGSASLIYPALIHDQQLTYYVLHSLCSHVHGIQLQSQLQSHNIRFFFTIEPVFQQS